jgi:hypothetical protein
MMNSLPFERIGGETIVLYADLRERLETFEAMRSIASLPGEFTSKVVKGIRCQGFPIKNLRNPMRYGERPYASIF